MAEPTRRRRPPRAAEKPSAGARETRSRRRTTVPRRDPQAGPSARPAMRRSPGASKKKKPVTLVSMMIRVRVVGHAGSEESPFSLPAFSHIFHYIVVYRIPFSLPAPYRIARRPQFAGGRRESVILCSEQYLSVRERLRLRHFSLTSAEREPAHTAHTPPSLRGHA